MRSTIIFITQYLACAILFFSLPSAYGLDKKKLCELLDKPTPSWMEERISQKKSV